MLQVSRTKIMNLKYLPEIFAKLSEMLHESGQILISGNFVITVTGIRSGHVYIDRSHLKREANTFCFPDCQVLTLLCLSFTDISGEGFFA